MLSKRARIAFALTSSIAWTLAGCYDVSEHGSETSTSPGAPSRPIDPLANDARERAQLLDALDHSVPTNVLVVLDEPDAATASTVRAKVRSLVGADDMLFAGASLPIVGVALRERAALDTLLHTPHVLRVEPVREHTISAVPSLELIHQPAAFARGADGRGLSVAVLDTGVDFTTADLGSCSAPGGSCIVSYAQDFAPSDGLNDDAGRHGTNVASIIHAVAPQAHILALDVFTGASGSSLDIIAALDWIVTNRATYSIVAANMSLGYGGFTAACPSDAMAVAIGRVRDAGVAVAVATGNNGYTNAISSPACAPAAVSVGAVDSSGVVASFSNSASFATLLAPGVGIAGGGVIMSGTSQATPHVAGSFAALRTAYPSDSVTDAVARLVGTGVRTVDARNGVALPRLDLGAATAGGTTAPPPDITPPTGTFVLAGPWVNVTAVPYTITASDASGVTSLCLSTATTCTTFVPFAASGTVTVPTGAGTKTVRAWLRDGAGNTTTTPLVATTSLDTTKPTTGAVTATAGNARVSLVIGASTDGDSGIAAYRTVFSTGTAAPTSCAAGTSLGDSASTTIAHEALTNGTTYRYRVCAVDRAGNVSTGSTTTATPVLERDPPTGTIVLAGGAAWTSSTTVTATLSATDASTVSSVCLSAASSCTSWITMAETTTFRLATGNGSRTVNAWFRDVWGNVSLSPASDSITLDTTLPNEVSAVSVARTDATLTLSWAAVEDNGGGSGLHHYLVAKQSGATAPSTCAGGTSVPAASGTVSTALTGLTNGSAYAYRVCAVDVAGNVSRGVTGSAVPAPEIAPPTGSIVVAGGAAWTNTRSVTVTVSASDASGVAKMCLSTTATCTAWATYATTATVSLATTQGAQTVNAWFRDIYGNTSASPVSDGISLDTVLPTAPAVTATARSRRVELQIGGSTDTGSGVASYVVISALGTRAPANCTSATAVAEATPRIASISATSSVGWRVCARDTAGNLSAGTSGVTVPLP